jgi:hypothetical protein
MLVKITMVLALACAAVSGVAMPIGASFAQSSPTLDCTPHHGAGSSPC